MVEEQTRETTEKPLVAITTLGSSVHRYADLCKQLLTNNGYEPIVFHTVGTNACERIIREGFVDGLLDLSMFELVNYVCGGAIKGGEEKITAACDTGIPQVVAPGALGWFQWTGTKDTLPSKYKDRSIRMHNPLTLQVPTTGDEKVEVAKLMASRLNKAKKGTTLLLIPLKGFSEMDKKGMPFYDPEGRRRFVEVLQQTVNPKVVEIVQVDAHINDEAFSQNAVEFLLRRMVKRNTPSWVSRKRMN